ncbi:MAG: putative DNA modification/repair radical SAM protein [Clostridia bacterium]|nr:putative DNA modification/repair radical SAM protein [Clostridia bacterium]
MDGRLFEKLKILADSAKYDVSCSTSGTERRNNGRMGNTSCAGICHSWSADGRCISLLKVLYSNKCVYDCAYCVNRRSADCERASFEPEELAELTMEFYRRNYIEGLFLSSAVEVSPDYTAERIYHALLLLRNKYEFAGYIHAKIIPGVSQELIERIGMVADRLSVNVELPTEKSLKLFAPQKKSRDIFLPMRQITNTLIEEKSLRGPGVMFKGRNLNTASEKIDIRDGYIDGGAESFALQTGGAGQSDLSFLTPMGRNVSCGDGSLSEVLGCSTKNAVVDGRKSIKKEKFAPAGQTTQMIIGAGGESDRQIIKTSESLYRTFKVKRVYFSAYIPVVDSPILPSLMTPPPLRREHRLYQADWLLRFYGFAADEILDDENPFLDTELDPKISWALRNISMFPVEVNKATMEELLRIPGIGTTSAMRIIRQRRYCAVSYDDLKKMGVVLKRARFFITCRGRYYGGKDIKPEIIRASALKDENFLNPAAVRRSLVGDETEKQLSFFDMAVPRGIEGTHQAANLFPAEGSGRDFAGAAKKPAGQVATVPPEDAGNRKEAGV